MTLAGDPDWWRGAVIYQIYPRSYQDSTGDGVGDLRGITDRLDHVAELGADAIWISPFFRSPMRDFGYDVTDYRDIDPMFGTLADFDALIARAHDLGLRVMIDLVLSHTSSDHPWFAESRSSHDNPRADWYVWADPKPDGSPPNNWLSIFGGSAWEWDGTRMQYYLHNFLIEQPDLNFHCPAVQDEMLDVARFWLDRGLDGFRLDTVNFYFHDPLLRDNPALPPEARNDNTAPAVNPYNFQDHLYDKTRPENLVFLERLRALMDHYPGATSVGEVGEAQRGMEVQAEYTDGPARLHMCYDFEFLGQHRPGAARFAEVVGRFDALAPRGWACWAFSNHDVTRHATRWGLDGPALRAHAALLMALRGSICLYQGEELGLPEAEIGFDDLQDPYGKRFWPRFKGRDGCRTPMPWDGQGGFSTGRPWLPMPQAHRDRAVRVQAGDPGSLLEFYRAMLAFRRAHPPLVRGTMEVIAADETALLFRRLHDGQGVLCGFNLSATPRVLSLPAGDRVPLAAPLEGAWQADALHLPPWGAAFAAEV